MKSKVISFFKQHLEEAGESYFEHMMWALTFSVMFFFAGIACFVHSIFPFLFQKTGSSIAKWILQKGKQRNK